MGLRRSCAVALADVADAVAPPPPPAPAVASEATPGGPVYDAELPPDVPPGETLDQWRRERHPAAHPVRRRLARPLRRLAHALDGTVIDTHQMRL